MAESLRPGVDVLGVGIGIGIGARGFAIGPGCGIGFGPTGGLGFGAGVRAGLSVGQPLFMLPVRIGRVPLAVGLVLGPAVGLGRPLPVKLTR